MRHPRSRSPRSDIGDRQKGRLQASSVINCKPESADIVRAIKEALTKDCSNTINPYGNGNSAQQIVALLKSIPDFNTLLKKHFFNIA